MVSLSLNLKVKFVPVHAMRVYRWSRGVVPHVLTLGARCRQMVNITPLPLYFREKLDTHWTGDIPNPRAHLDVLRKKYIASVRFRTPDRPSLCQVCIPTTLSRPIISVCAGSNVGQLVSNALTRERSWHNWYTTLELTCNERGESRYSPVSIVDLLAENSTTNLPNTSRKCYNS